MLETRVLTDGEIRSDVLAQICRLVFDAYDGDFSEEDWDHTRGGWRVVVFDGGAPVSHAAVVARVLEVGQRTLQTGYVEGVATTEERRRQGLGALVMSHATSLVQSKFEMGALSTSSHGFYERFGWERWRGHSFVRDGATLVRTADEDHGLMVLRSGPSAGIDLAAPIVSVPGGRRLVAVSAVVINLSRPPVRAGGTRLPAHQRRWNAFGTPGGQTGNVGTGTTPYRRRIHSHRGRARPSTRSPLRR